MLTLWIFQQPLMSNSLEKAFNGSALNYKPSWVYARVRAVTGTKHIGYYMQCIRIFSGRGSIVTAKEGNTIISKDYGSYLEYVEQLSHATMAEPPLRPKSPLAVSVYVIFFAQTDITNADSPRLLHNADCSTVTCYRTCFWGEIKRHSKKIKNKYWPQLWKK